MNIFKRHKTDIDPLHYNDYFFYNLGVSRNDAFDMFASIVAKIGIDSKDADAMYRPAWCALKLSGFEPKTILELGTYRGFSAVFLAMLWPEAHVYTVDLPQDDPLYYKWLPEPGHQTPLLYELPNITFIKANSMHIQQTEIKDLQVDLLFIDAGHNNPTMSFDHLYWLDHVVLGGWLFSDDVMPEFDPVNGKGNVIWQTIKYANERNPDKFQFLLQREDPERFKADGKNGKRKYIGVLHKAIK